ncbi:hypothetical protein NIES4071_103210 (plasmid) [Calothrix sp. NIES-4071]|nr:hypothetical protein NIES4071_103210 [Calothrix sp. NIES-4071]BAZ64702.1 hypothetical protein NIES4105_104350 [Calothrix sp. NIES-4105]BDA75931.1 hypothetical protein CAL7716_100970 [Calothrix sp. PCC 7716]
MSKPIPSPEVRQKHLEGLKKTCAEIQQSNEMMDKLIAHLDTQIAKMPERMRRHLKDI